MADDHIKIDDIPPEIRYTVGSVAQSQFEVPFAFFADGDLQVFIDDTLLTLGADYTVTGAGTSGTALRIVTLTTAVTNVTVTILRDLEIARTDDFPNSGPFRISALNTALDRLTAYAQDLKNSTLRRVWPSLNWDAMGRRLINLGASVDATDAATRGDVLSIAGSGDASTLAAAKAYADAGDATEASARIAGDAATLTAAKAHANVGDASTLSSVRSYADAVVAGVQGGHGSFIQDGTGAVVRTFQDKLRETISVTDFLTLPLAVAAVAGRTIVVTSGDHEVSADLTIPADVTLLFLEGGYLVIGTDVTLTINGGIIAGPYQRIFKGHLVQSDFMSGVTPPYVFGVQGSPRVAWSSPFWFGAAGDDVTDDKPAIDCALWFGDNCYIPHGTYSYEGALLIKKSNCRVWGDGRGTKITQRNTGPSGTGALLSIFGNAGTVYGVTVENLWLDTSDQVNENGIGLGQGVHDCRVRNIWLSNVGRKAITIQYDCSGNYIEDIFVEDAAQESGSTGYAVSIEGTNAEGGADVYNNVVRNVRVNTSGFGAVALVDCMNNTIENVYVANLPVEPAAGGGVLIRARQIVKGCVVRNVKAGNISNGLVVADETVEGCLFEDIHAEAVTGTGATSTASTGLLILGNRNTLRDFSFAQQDTNNAAIDVGGDYNVFERVHIFSIVHNTAVAVRATASHNAFCECQWFCSGASTRVVEVAGPHNKFIDNYIEAGNSTAQGIRITAPGNTVRGNTVTGDGSGRIRVEAGATGSIVVENILTGATPSIDKFFAGASESVIMNNVGDDETTNSYLRLGPYRLWVDGTGDLRVSNGVPASDTGGVVVGTQS